VWCEIIALSQPVLLSVATRSFTSAFCCATVQCLYFVLSCVVIKFGIIWKVLNSSINIVA